MDNGVRIGIVTAIDGNSKMVRVHFTDDDIISDWLDVVQSSNSTFMPDVGDAVLCLYTPGFNADGYILGVVKK